MIEFDGELHDEILGYFASGSVFIVEDGDEWEGSIDLTILPGRILYQLMQNDKLRGTVKIDHVSKEAEGYSAHFVGVGALRRV